MKKLVSILLTLVIVFSFVGCRSSNTTQERTASNSEAEPAVTNETNDETKSLEAVKVNWPEFITIGGGGSSATFYAVATAVAKLISDNTDCTASGQATNGGTHNMQLLKSGEIEFGMADQYTANQAYQGLGDFSGNAVDSLRAIAVIYRGYFAIQATPKSGIETIDKILGKTVCVGMANSGTETVTRNVFGALGIDYTSGKGIQAEYVGASSGTDLLRNGQADAMTFLAPIPDPSQTEIMLTANTHLVSLSDEAIAALTVKGSPLAAGVISAGTYDSQKEDIYTVYAPMVLWTTTEMDDEVVYQITKMLYENLDYLALSNAVFGAIDDTNIIAGISIPLHDGAKRFYGEIGIVP